MFEVFCYDELVARPVDEAVWRRVVGKLNSPGGAYPIACGEQIERRPKIEVRRAGGTVFYQASQ